MNNAPLVSHKSKSKKNAYVIVCVKKKSSFSFQDYKKLRMPPMQEQHRKEVLELYFSPKVQIKDIGIHPSSILL